MPRVDVRLNPLLDADVLAPDDLAAGAGAVARGGATLIQYRDKTGTTRRMVERARAILAALAGSGVPLLVNDRVDVALAAGAHGVHLGRADMAPADARRLLGPEAIIGATVKDDADADAAIAAPVDYACIGGVFTTISKNNPDPPVGLEGLSRLAASLRAARPDLPVGAIAGIDMDGVPGVIGSGADGVAVISAIFRAPDPEQAARRMRARIDGALGRRGGRR